MYCISHKLMSILNAVVHILILRTDWTKKNSAIIWKNNYFRCFQYTAIIILDFDQVGKSPQIIMELYLFMNKYNWYQINYPLEKDDSLKLGKINWKIEINVLYENEKEMSQAYISKHNLILSLALSCNNKIVFISKRSNIKPPWWLLIELSLYLWNRK